MANPNKSLREDSFRKLAKAPYSIIMNWLLLLLALFSVVTTFLPVLSTKLWWVQAVDFPRVQIIVLIIALLLVMHSVQFLHGSSVSTAIYLLLALSLLRNVQLVLPYTPLFAWAKTPSASNVAVANRLRLIVANVEMTNQQYQPLLDLIDRIDPDLICAVEVDERWVGQLESLHDRYPHRVLHPLDNTYGMALYSKLPLVNVEVKYLVRDDVPSIHAGVVLRNRFPCQLHLVHPKPPAPAEAKTTRARDRELLLLADFIDATESAVIVAGDLNDVAWSWTTKRFIALSELRDLRVGRGLYSTFHARLPFLRFPLDHVFCSDHFSLQRMERLSSIGSDHFPILVELGLRDRDLSRSLKSLSGAPDEDPLPSNDAPA